MTCCSSSPGRGAGQALGWQGTRRVLRPRMRCTGPAGLLGPLGPMDAPHARRRARAVHQAQGDRVLRPSGGGRPRRAGAGVWQARLEASTPGAPRDLRFLPSARPRAIAIGHGYLRPMGFTILETWAAKPHDKRDGLYREVIRVCLAGGNPVMVQKCSKRTMLGGVRGVSPRVSRVPRFGVGLCRGRARENPPPDYRTLGRRWVMW